MLGLQAMADTALSVCALIAAVRVHNALGVRQDLWHRTLLGAGLACMPSVYPPGPAGDPMSQILTIFLAVFLAEIGDKTQLAALLFASHKDYSPWLVFIAASCALVATTALAVLLGAAAERYVTAMPMRLIAGLLFVAIGGWMIVDHLRTAA